MADDTDITGGVGEGRPRPVDVEATELTPEASGGWWPPRPAVIIIFGGFIAVVVAAILIALATGGDGTDTAIETAVGDPAVQPAGDDSSDDAQQQSDESSDRSTAGDFVGEAASEPTMFGGGGDWLVPWQDGFLRFGLIFEPPPLPELDGRFADLFPPEVVDALEAAGVTNIDDATRVLEEAGLYDQVLEIIDANPEVADLLFGVEPPPPTFEISQSSDGLDWVPLDGVSIPGGESIAWVQSDGEHLVVSSHEYDDFDESGHGTSTVQVSVTSDLLGWETYDITGTAGDNVPDLVQVDTSISAVAIGPNGWLAATNTYAFIDEWALLPEDIRATDGGWELTADESGLTVEIFESEFELVYDEEGNIIDETFNEDCCDVVETRVLSWDEVETDYATWQQYRESGGNSMSVWTASWGQAPGESPLPPRYGTFGSAVGTDSGFLAVSWPQELEGEFSEGNVLLFSPDGRSWTEVASPAGGDTWLDQLVAVDGGVIATVSGPTGQMILLGDSKGTNWEEVEVPGIPDSTWIWFNPGSGAAAIVDATDYGEFGECIDITESVFVEIDLPGHFIFIESWPGGTTLFIEDLANNAFIDAYSALPYPEGTPDFMSFDDVAGEVAFLDPETGEEVVRMPTDQFLAAWDQAVAHAEEGVVECAVAAESVPFPEADFWLLATNDGRTWLVEDLDDGGAEMEPYPQQAAINGNVVVARIGESWSRYTIG